MPSAPEELAQYNVDADTLGEAAKQAKTRVEIAAVNLRVGAHVLKLFACKVLTPNRVQFINFHQFSSHLVNAETSYLHLPLTRKSTPHAK
jgi:hypothetical protein